MIYFWNYFLSKTLISRRPIHWTQYVWRREFWRTNQLKEDPPGQWVIAKGSTHIAASRALIGYILFNETARDLLNWMRDIRAPDEHFFQTLNHNPHMNVPGSYKGRGNNSSIIV